MAKNIVLAGDYEGKGIAIIGGNKGIGIVTSFMKFIMLDKTTVESYELITDEHRKSASSGIARGLVGGALLGPVGLLAGVSAKNVGTYQVAIQFKDGKRSMVELDDKNYKMLLKNCF